MFLESSNLQAGSYFSIRTQVNNMVNQKTALSRRRLKKISYG